MMFQMMNVIDLIELNSLFEMMIVIVILREIEDFQFVFLKLNLMLFDF